jgi:hypothetical protein
MTPQLTVPRSVFASVLNNLYPRDDDPGPYGPFDPVIRRVAELMLNPQPLPPKQAWQRDAWFGAAAADATIRYALDRQELAESVDAPNRINELVRASIQQFVDDLCPQPPRPPRWPFPWPRPKWWEQGEIGPLDVLVAGARFYRAAETMPDNALAADFDAGADTLFEAGLRLAG